MWERLRFFAVGLLMVPVLTSASTAVAAPVTVGAFPAMSLSLEEISQQPSVATTIAIPVPPPRLGSQASSVAAPQPVTPTTCQRPAAPTKVELVAEANGQPLRGSTTWAYAVVAFNACGDSAQSSAATITNGPDRMDASTWRAGGTVIWVSWSPVAGLSCEADANHPAIEPCSNGYKVIRTISGPTPPEPAPCPTGTLVHNHPAFSSYKWGDNGAGCGLGVYH